MRDSGQDRTCFRAEQRRTCYNARLSFPLEEIITVDVKCTEHPDIYTRKEPSLRKENPKRTTADTHLYASKPKHNSRIHVLCASKRTTTQLNPPTTNQPQVNLHSINLSLHSTPLHRFVGINFPIHLDRLHPCNPPKLLFRVLPKLIHQPFLPVPVQEFPHQVSRTLALQIDRVDAASCCPVGSACDGDFTAQGDPRSYVPVRGCGIPAQRPESVCANVCEMLNAQDTRKM